MRTRRILIATGALTVGLVGAGAGPAAAGTPSAAPATGAAVAVAYQTVDLGGFGGAEGRATALNASGQVVGYSQTPAGQRRAFLFSDGRLTDLGTLGGASASAADINAVGQVVGFSDTANGESHAFLWSQGIMTDLGTLGRSGSAAAAINDTGTVVGTVFGRVNGNDNGSRAFVWRAGQMTLLAGLPGSGIPGSDFFEGTTATDVNLDGDVVGLGKGHAAVVRWHQGIPTVLFGTASFVSVDRPRINGPGDVLASYYPAHIATVLLWRAGSTESVRDPTGPRSFSASASAINDDHQFVGGYSDSTELFKSLPYVSAGDSTLLDLTTRGLAATARLSDINNSGQIAGSVIVSNGTHPALFIP